MNLFKKYTNPLSNKIRVIENSEGKGVSFGSSCLH